MTTEFFQTKRYSELYGIVTEGGEGRHSLVDEVHDEILLRIIRGEWKAGTELKTTVLAKQLEVSRTPVMTALARLAADGVVNQPPNLRAVVRSGAEDWLVDIHEMRQLIEPVAARASAGQIPEAVWNDLQLLRKDARPGKDCPWQEAARYFDYSLHLVIAEYCGNLPMREEIRRFWNYKRLSYREGQDTEIFLKAGYRQHVGILAALGDGDGERAEELMRQHLQSAGKLKPGQRIL